MHAENRYNQEKNTYGKWLTPWDFRIYVVAYWLCKLYKNRKVGILGVGYVLLINI